MRRTARLASTAGLVLAAVAGCGGGSVEEFCETGEQLDFNAAGQEIHDALDEAADAAPDEIRDDVETVRDAVHNPENADAQQVQEALGNVRTFVRDNC